MGWGSKGKMRSDEKKRRTCYTYYAIEIETIMTLGTPVGKGARVHLSYPMHEVALPSWAAAVWSCAAC